MIDNFKEFAAQTYANGVYDAIMDSDLVDDDLGRIVDEWNSNISPRVEGKVSEDTLCRMHCTWINSLVREVRYGKGTRFNWWKVWFAAKIMVMLFLMAIGTLEFASWIMGWGYSGILLTSTIGLLMLLTDLFVEAGF